MLQPILDQLPAAVVVVLLCCFAGFGPTRWLLPRQFRSWFWIATPLTGLAVAGIALGWISAFLPLRYGVWVLAALCALGTAAGLLPQAPRLGPQQWREQAIVALLALVALGAALAPLWGRPDLLSIGPNWDVEIYLPLAEYLKAFATGFTLTNPAGLPFPGNPNPLLWRLNFFDPRWAGLAFSELHAAAGSLLRQEAHHNFAGVLAVLYALSVPAGFMLFRGAFGFPRLPSLLTAALLAISPAGLYVVYWSFGQQAASLPLLPWALATGAVALTDATGRAQLLAGLILAGLMAAFLPVTPVYFAGVALLIVIRLVMVRRSRVLDAAGGIGATAIVVAPWAVLRGIERLVYFVQDQGTAGLTTGADVSEFPPLGWAFGLFAGPDGAFLGILASWVPFVEIVSPILRVLLVILVGVALIWASRQRNQPVLAFALGAFILLLVTRFVAGYAYGYLKLLASVSFLLVGFAVIGARSLAQILASPRPAMLTRRGLPLAAVLLICATVAATSGFIQRMHGGGSTMALRDLEALEQAVPPGSSVFVSGHKEYQGPAQGAISYFLRDARLYGYIVTGFSTFYREKPSGTYDYALFNQQEAIPQELYSADQLVWQNDTVRLYRGDASVKYFEDLGRYITPPIIDASAGHGSTAGLRIDEWTAEGYPAFTGWSPPLLGVLAVTEPPETDYPEVANRTPFALDVPTAPPPPDEDAPRVGMTAPVPSTRQEMVLTFAAFRQQDVTVLVNNRPRPLTLRAGVHPYSIGLVRAPAKVEIHNNVNAPVYVKSVMLREPGSAARTLPQIRNPVLLQWSAQEAEHNIRIALNYLGPNYKPVLDIYSSDGTVHYGWWELPPPQGRRSYTFRFRFDPSRQQLQVMQRQTGTQEVAPGERGPVADATYQAYLALWQQDRLVRLIPLFRFRLEKGVLHDPPKNPGSAYIG